MQPGGRGGEEAAQHSTALKRPKYHMCGMLQKKIKIKEKNIQKTMKPQNIWRFIARSKGKA